MADAPLRLRSITPRAAGDRVIAAAAARELVSQTPPLGGSSPFYHCPACLHEEAQRGVMRAHLLACAAFAAFIAGCVRRADLEHECRYEFIKEYADGTELWRCVECPREAHNARDRDLPLAEEN
jgi:hypothetical protein